MADFSRVYSEDSNTATLTLGIDGLAGRLVLRAKVEVDRGRAQTVDLLSIDVDKMEMEAGVRELGKLLKIDLETIILDAGKAELTLGGGSGRGEGRVAAYNKYGIAAFEASAATGEVSVGASKTNGLLSIRNAEGVDTIRAIGRHGNLVLGATGADGDLSVRNAQDQEMVQVDGNTGVITTKAGDGAVTSSLDGRHGNLVLGGQGHDGDLRLKRENDEVAIAMDGESAEVRVGGGGQNGRIRVADMAGATRIDLRGSDGDIVFQGADLAEEFTLSPDFGDEATPGSVVVLDDNGRVAPCTSAKDKRVAGVIAGAGQYQPAMVLDRRDQPGRIPVAMIGKVACRTTTTAGPIQVGDLLITSQTRGHAQKLADDEVALGCVIGKALAPLASGSGLIPVLVNLQ